MGIQQYIKKRQKNMYEDILEDYSAEEIVKKIRENSEKSIINHNSFLGFNDNMKEEEKFRHGKIDVQLKYIQYLLDRNINVEIVNMPVSLTEDNKPVTVKSFAIVDNKINFSDKINKNIKTVFFYTWIKLPEVEGRKEERDLLRFDYMEDRCKIKRI